MRSCGHPFPSDMSKRAMHKQHPSLPAYSDWERKIKLETARKQTAIALGWLALSTFSLAGCSSSILDLSSLGSSVSTVTEAPYLPVNDLPPDRDEPLIEPDQIAKIQSELIAARDHQAVPNAKKK